MVDGGLDAELTILFRLFGGVRRSHIHDMVSEKNGILADLTEAAQEAREDLAARRSDVAEPAVRDTRMRIVRKSEATFWAKAPELAEAEGALAKLRSKLVDVSTKADEEQNDEKRAARRAQREKLRARIVVAEGKAEALREAMWAAMAAADGDELRPVYATMVYADRTTTAIEAIEARITSSEPREAKDAFIGTIREQCRELEARARAAFVAAGKAL
jgi:hypothetical protein